MAEIPAPSQLAAAPEVFLLVADEAAHAEAPGTIAPSQPAAAPMAVYYTPPSHGLDVS